MDLVRDTPLETGFLFWPLRPPRTSMIVVVKATFRLEPGISPLAAAQRPTTGETFWDQDPERSLRHPGDFALLKPRGECFVVGHCRTLTEQPQERTVASFRVGSVTKRFAVYGDRTWSGSAATRPVPFEAMPLCWERAFGGPGLADNPMGRGIEAGADGVVRLPNLELEDRPITSPADRPAPIAPVPLLPSWASRKALTGTYDERWRQTRWPWLPEDFRFEWFNTAPRDQQVQGFWAGNEAISLRHLHPRHPQLDTRLLPIVARAFVERTAEDDSPGAFEEIALALDTITIDADTGEAELVWRGALELAHEKLEPEGLTKLFVMHEPMPGEGQRVARLEDCRARMDAKIAADAAALQAMEGTPPPEEESDATVADGDEASAAAAAEAHEILTVMQAEAAAKQAPDPTEALAKLEADLLAAGVDVQALLAKAEADAAASPPEPFGPASLDKLKETFEAQGHELPAEMVEEWEKLLEEHQARLDAVPPAPEAPEPPSDLRAVAIDLHKRNQPLTGDFSGVNLAGLDLRGLDARDAILVDASFRGTNLGRAKLDGATLLRADFLSASLAGASLRKADLTDAILEGCDLEGATLTGATLERAEMMDAKLDRAKLAKADLTDADLTGATLREAVLDEAILIDAKLARCNLTKASLVETRMYGVTAPELLLDHADVRKVRFGRGADLTGGSAKGVRGEDSNWRACVLDGVSFIGSKLDGADFSGSRLDGANLGGCCMRKAVLRDCSLVDASLLAADLYEATLHAANVTKADLRRANLFRVGFFKAYGEGVLLDGANLDGTMWERR